MKIRFPTSVALAVAVASLVLACTRAPAPPPARPPEAGPDAGTVSVELQPTGVEVVADGVHRCRTPCSFRLSPGLHRLTVRTGGFMPWQEDVRVETGAEVKVSASLVGSH